MTSPITIAVGLSGGVDSTMAAWLLQQQGHTIIGLTMQMWDGAGPLPGEGRSGCYGPGEAQRLKFGYLLDRARELGVAFDAFATGHYARVARDEASGRCRLLRGADPKKDQSYFLARLTQDQLRQVRFPLGGLHKADVLQLARNAGFGDIAGRAESQDFIESEDYAPLFPAADRQPGSIVDTAGRVLGQHRGIVHYTVGQRAGLGVAAAERLYVKELRPDTNTVVLSRRAEVLSAGCRITEASWISGTPPTDGTACVVRLRYRHAGVPATLHPLPDGAWRADFAEPQFAVTPGQAAVFYAGDEVLGGGWIGKTT
ncbi:MAG: tRNA 2-thiouridine(34) synthase MnmA [Kiritimatiellaeota bacterium]|nr:tRNA 2-thiouridine(34) synthase MnmA [Kiritimatiellota bacterium]